jgi:hypothetical protein
MGWEFVRFMASHFHYHEMYDLLLWHIICTFGRKKEMKAWSWWSLASAMVRGIPKGVRILRISLLEN